MHFTCHPPTLSSSKLHIIISAAAAAVDYSEFKSCQGLAEDFVLHRGTNKSTRLLKSPLRIFVCGRKPERRLDKQNILFSCFFVIYTSFLQGSILKHFPSVFWILWPIGFLVDQLVHWCQKLACGPNLGRSVIIFGWQGNTKSPLDKCVLMRFCLLLQCMGLNGWYCD